MTKLAAQQVDGANPIGVISSYAGRLAPAGWLLCYGQAVLRATYLGLFNVISPSLGAFTVTLATPGVFTLTAHGLNVGDQVYLTTTGALPTGLTANTLYYVATGTTANTFNLSTTRANAYAGTKIATSTSQSGVHSLVVCPYGLGDGSTTFNIPDLRGRVIAGDDNIGGTAASRLTLAQTQGIYGNAGASGGEQGHIIITAELAAHTHTYTNDRGLVSWAGGSSNGSDSSLGASKATGSTGSDTAHNNIQPAIITNQIIKAY